MEQQPVNKGARVLSCVTAIQDHGVITSVPGDGRGRIADPSMFILDS